MTRAERVLRLVNALESVEITCPDCPKKVTFLDYKHSRSHGSSMGYVGINFRDKPKPDSMTMFSLNSFSDGWFRSDTGNAKGYGLAIMSVKVTSKNHIPFGKHFAYKATMTHIPSDKEDEADKEKASIWLFVHQSFELDDVLQYIRQNSSKWRA